MVKALPGGSSGGPRFPSSHEAAHNHLELKIQCPLLAVEGIKQPTWCTGSHAGKTLINKIRLTYETKELGDSYCSFHFLYSRFL